MEISRMYMEKCFGKLKSLGIHPRQMPILAVLWKEDGCSQKELASQLGVKPPTVTVSIQRLEKIGIIVRKKARPSIPSSVPKRSTHKPDLSYRRRKSNN